jgi:arsenate reductase-like glutaredoxin family protein
MRLYEFAGDDPLRIKLAAVANQLRDRVEGSGTTLSTDELLNFLKKNDIVLDKPDLYDIVKKEPLKNIIKSVNKDEVTFINAEGDDDQATNAEPEQDDSEKIRQQMAKKAMS